MSAPALRTAAAGRARYTYLEAGQGEALVLLHGVGSAARSWQHQLATLAADFRVVAWDAPGYGGSSTLDAAEPDAGDYARALEAFLAAVGVERLHLVGHSLGSIMAARYARLHPDRIATLTLASVAVGHARLPAAERERLKAGRLDDLAALGPRGLAEKRGPRLVAPHADDAVRRAVVETMALIRPDGYPQAVHMLAGADTCADVRALDPGLRVQFIYGDFDVITTPEQNFSVHRERPSAPVHRIEGAGHAVYLEQPAAFDALVRRHALQSRA